MATGGRKSRTDEIDVRAADRSPRTRSGKGKGKGSRSGKGGGWFASGRLRWLRIAAGVALVGAIAGVAGLTGLFIYYGSDPNLPNIKKLSDYKPPQTSRVYDRHGKLIGTLGPQRRTVVPFAKIPKILVQAVVAAEDPHYFQHERVDYRGIVRAFVENTLRLRWGRSAQGGSTITQQVVKNMLLTREKTLRRKVQEMILARQLSQSLSKEEILEIYLNQINYGQARYGCEEGARYYFGKSVTEIDLAEAAFLAGVPQIPELLSPYKNPQAAKNRQIYVLAQMAKHGYIPQKRADKLAAEPLPIVPQATSQPGRAPEAVDAVYRLLVEKHGREAIPTLGTTVKTTIDLPLQELAREAVERGLEDLDGRQGYRGPTGRGRSPKELARRRAELAKARNGVLKESAIVEGIVDKIERDPGNPKGGKLFVDVGGLQGVVDFAAETRYGEGAKPLAERFRPGDYVRVRAAPERRRIGSDDKQLLLALELGPQAAMVVMDPRSREILALVGGYNFRAGGFDRAQRALRQAGSTFKPFVYAAAIDSGRYTAASVVNDAPEVYDLWKPENYEKGSFRGPVRLRIALADSINTIPIKLLHDLKVPTVKELAARAGITTQMPDDLNLSLALGAASVSPLELANAYATFATGGDRDEARLVTAMGDEPLERAVAQKVLRPETAYVVTSMMRSVVEAGTGRAAYAKLRRPLAGKTGTSNGQKDAWFVGFTPDLLAVVWVGFDDGRSLGAGEAGGKTALPIWTDFMARALSGRPVKDFVQPPGITVVRIDPATGLLAPTGADGFEEVFLAGTEPKETAPTQGEASTADQVLLER